MGMTLFSDDKTGPVQLGQEDNAQVSYRETLYEPTGDGDCSHGTDPVGTVLVQETDPQWEDKRQLTVIFTFTEQGRKGSIVAHGIVERDGEGKLSGKLGGGSGTGKQKDWGGQIELNECNPKRWIFDPALGSGS